MRLAGLAQLIMSSCPTQTPDGPLGKLAVAQDRLTTMLFAVMTIGPALQTFYDSLSDTQKAEFNKVIRQQLRAGLGT
jgi:LTXXQ motif family protein